MIDEWIPLIYKLNNLSSAFYRVPSIHCLSILDIFQIQQCMHGSNRYPEYKLSTVFITHTYLTQSSGSKSDLGQWNNVIAAGRLTMQPSGVHAPCKNIESERMRFDTCSIVSSETIYLDAV